MKKQKRMTKPVEDLAERAAQRARNALGRFATGVAHVVVHDGTLGEHGVSCRTLVGDLRDGAVSVREVVA